MMDSLPIRDRKIAPLPKRTTRGNNDSISTTQIEQSWVESKLAVHAPKTAVEVSSTLTHSSSSGAPKQDQTSNDKLNSVQSTVPNQAKVPYDINTESSPNELFYTASFQNTLKDGMAIPNQVSDALATICLHNKDPRLLVLKQVADDLSNYQCVETRTIALLGNSGEGKSSLINSLLHYPRIARTEDLGSACTSIVTEFRQKTAQHSAPITVEVEHLDQTQIKDQIKELLWSYRKLYLPNSEDGNVSAEEYEKAQRESEVARCSLDAVFSHNSGYNPHFLQDMSAGAEDRITDQLIQWSSELQWPNGGETCTAGLWKSTAQTADEACEKTDAFMKTKLWPFTKVIRIYLDSPVLETGIILADLPGLQDTNLARVKATQEYLLRCDHIFIIAKISRAITDQSLKSSLYHVLSKHVPLEWESSGGRYLNVAVICTRSEDINETAAMKEFCGSGKRISPSIIQEIDQKKKAAKDAGNLKLSKEYKQQRQRLLINARNSHVKEGLQSAYAAKVPGGNLEVFCVSNTIYEKYAKKGNGKMVIASEIPALRSFCYSITAQTQLLEATHFLKTRVPALLHSIQIWLDNESPKIAPQLDLEATEQRKKAAYHQLELAKPKIKATVRETERVFTSDFAEQILAYTRRTETWEARAEQEGEAWSSWHWTQYNAWCRNNGDHSTEKRKSVNWNQKLVWKMRSELEYQWEILEDGITEQFSELEISLVRELGVLQLRFREIGVSPAVHRTLNLQIDSVRRILSLIKQQYAREMQIIRRKASEGNAGSYMVKEMLPAYRSAAMESGRGKAGHQRVIVQRRITNGTLFPNICVTMKDQFDERTKTILSQLDKDIAKTLEHVRSDLEMVLGQISMATSKNGSVQEHGIGQRKLQDTMKTLAEDSKKIVEAVP